MLMLEFVHLVKIARLTETEGEKINCWLGIWNLYIDGGGNGIIESRNTFYLKTLPKWKRMSQEHQYDLHHIMFLDYANNSLWIIHYTAV